MNTSKFPIASHCICMLFVLLSYAEELDAVERLEQQPLFSYLVDFYQPTKTLQLPLPALAAEYGNLGAWSHFCNYKC